MNSVLRDSVLEQSAVRQRTSHSDPVPGSHFLQLPLLKESCPPMLFPTERVQHLISGILWRFSTWIRRKSPGPGCSVAEHSTYMCEANRLQPPHHRRGRRKGASGTWGGRRRGKRQRRRAPKTKKAEKKPTMWFCRIIVTPFGRICPIGGIVRGDGGRGADG